MYTQIPSINPFDAFTALAERARALHEAAKYPALVGCGVHVDPFDLSGQWLGDHYRLQRPLGQRGVTLYQATGCCFGDRRLVRVVLGLDSDAACEAFLRRARAASQLQHGHIARVMDFGVSVLTDGAPAGFLIMEHLRGENLTSTLIRQGPLHWSRVLVIATQVCRALIAAHDRGIVHGDLKPANCLRISRPDAPDFIKILDFGMTAGAATHSFADDLHALGTMMYRLLTGRMPGLEPSLDHDPFMDEIPPGVAALVLASLAQDPTQRPTSARALHRALAAAASPSLDVAPVSAPPPGLEAPPVPAAPGPSTIITVIAARVVAPPCVPPAPVTPLPPIAVLAPPLAVAPSPSPTPLPERWPTRLAPATSAASMMLPVALASWHDWVFWLPLGATTMLFAHPSCDRFDRSRHLAMYLQGFPPTR